MIFFGLISGHSARVCPESGLDGPGTAGLQGTARERETGLVSRWPFRGVWRRAGVLAAAVFCAATWTGTVAYAQSAPGGRYFPLDQTAPPGVAAYWSTVRRDYAPVMQPVRVELPEGGQVSFFRGTPDELATFGAPAVAALRVGSIYRLKISGLRGYPGTEFYPTVELIDRLHPPRGREIEFAVPIELTDDDFAMAVEGRLVTKVVYLEQPERALPERKQAARNQLAAPRENALALADEAGRPMAIVRLGGRIPDGADPEPGFYGSGAPIQFFELPARGRETVRR